VRILLVGSGAREHALAWKIAQSSLLDKLFCAPGNGGISGCAECVDIKADDIKGLVNFARKEKIDFTVIGPEIPLALGVVDDFHNHRLKVFGPNKKAAQLEGSKVFAKQLMAKYGVPTADFRIFDNAQEAKDYIKKRNSPCVVKADGLAAGKGVVVAKDQSEAIEAVKSIMEDKVFQDAGRRVVIEDCLQGEEASIIVITDSKEVIPLASSQDHKRIFDDDQGPNTGGMGAYSPASVVSSEVFKEVMDKVIYRTIEGLAREGIDYKGALYAGIMLTQEGPKALEFNVRFGDPETQAILPRLRSDLLEVMLAASEERLNKISRLGGLSWDSRAAVCVVMACAGYPGNYEKGKEIFGLEEAAKMQDVVVFHAGTTREKTRYLTNAGRVLGVTGLGANIKEAIDRSYKAVEKISFEGAHYRRDIGRKALL
jgi:phosphoribosylamine--glycine ligase